MTKECTVRVFAGTCGMTSRITAKADDIGEVTLRIESDCHHILKMSWGLRPMFAYGEVEAPMCETEIYRLATENLPHAACPVPCGMMKALEVAGDMGIPRDSEIVFE
ncbi:MAG: hypothetical protein GX137_03625 [Thermoplasmatales archaeon]|jgi:hypothetical protein|nr:hypothetical protein [Thermoplasmatales archaeon]